MSIILVHPRWMRSHNSGFNFLLTTYTFILTFLIKPTLTKSQKSILFFIEIHLVIRVSNINLYKVAVAFSTAHVPLVSAHTKSAS